MYSHARCTAGKKFLFKPIKLLKVCLSKVNCFIILQ